MVKEKKLDIFNQIEENFDSHLTLKDNDRIIFSGKFGSGKTSFLNHFFNGEQQKKRYSSKIKYNVIHLYPINYSIASNDDIFNYLKYDIICDLLINKKIQINEEKSKTYLETFKKYSSKNIDKILGSFLPLIPLIGQNANELFKSLYKIKEEYLKYHDSNSESDTDKLTEFLYKIETDYVLYERDFITELIEQCLNQIKSEGEENILIIDDLDRIDPEHIFRILNVFAAHFDTQNDLPLDDNTKQRKNKFGFEHSRARRRR